MLELRAADGVRPEAIAEITCGVDYLAPTYLAFPRPQTAEEARFSLEYTVAIAAIDGQVGLRQFEPDRLFDPAVADLARRVRMYVHPEQAGRDSWKVRFVEMELLLRDGRRLRRRVYEQRGHPNNPLSTLELAAKYRDTAGRVLSPAAVEESLALLSRLDEVEDLTPLLRCVRGDEGS
jgi:2-methylcitrate dehydratase PrpD